MAIAVENDLALPRDPTSALHAATKQYVDGLVQGLQIKAVRVATTANITISTALNPGDSIDSTSLAGGDRVLVKDQTAAEQNGIYVVDAVPFRATDMDAWTEVPGSLVVVEAGSQHDTMWLSTSDLGGTLGTTTINFTQFRNATDLVAGGGIGLSGLTLFVAAGTGISQDADGVSIDTTVVPRKAVANTFTQPQTIDLGATGIPLTLDIHANGDKWLSLTEQGADRGELTESANGLTLSANAGGLTLAAAAGNVNLSPQAGGVINMNSNRVASVSDPTAATDAVNRQSAARTIPGTITGDGSTNPLTFTHNLNTKDVNVDVRNIATDEFVLAKVVASTVNAVTIEFATALGNTVTRRVIVTGIQG